MYINHRKLSLTSKTRKYNINRESLKREGGEQSS